MKRRKLVAQQRQSVDSEWSPLRNLASGTPLIVTVKGGPPGRRYFLEGGEFELRLLNVDEPTLPVAASDALRDIAATHPEYFRAAEKGGRFVMPRDVLLGPDGVFVSDRKVADLVQVLMRYRRADIAEIRTATIESNPLGCAFAGYFYGAIVGGLPGGLVGGAVIGDTRGALQGMVVGWAIGGIAMYRKCRHRPETVLYRAS